VAKALSGVKNLQAVVDTQTNTLRIVAQPGFAFDFAGRLASAPDTSAITGTTTVQIVGTYTGTKNDALTYRVATSPPGGSGTIGVTPGLTLQVQDSAGNAVASLNIGQGYQPGSPLQVGNGVTLQFTAGTANDGDQFTTRVTSNPDTSNILAALGINSFFTGTNAANLAVQPNLVQDPTQLAASQTGQPGDASNLQRIATLRDSTVLTNGTQTFEQYFSSVVGNIGTQVQQATQQQTAQHALGQQIQAQQQSVSGVDPNEELVQMLQYQRAFQLASKYISTVNSTLDSLMQLIAG
jgi:flagellar hook-associated protein FlgK